MVSPTVQSCNRNINFDMAEVYTEKFVCKSTTRNNRAEAEIMVFIDNKEHNNPTGKHLKMWFCEDQRVCHLITRG